ncbi:hypothetical protein [Zophobihabitans entericus]|uniref:Uncharacterized protein n=1 Tax=Zophobihabitans entericus TaxID=1635327 RepID=A0A6G9IB08_9GAMM|nr:hypothetical protein [Zophobihabitans entericus]QIQ21403.1 hypothetical protein IPMB12_06700 [Zophobihabitans entericus]
MQIQIPQGYTQYPDTEEVINQCCVLADAIDETENHNLKKVLFSVLKEKINTLRSCYLLEVDKIEQEWLHSTTDQTS